MLRRVLFLLILSCATGAVADAQASTPCEPPLPTDPSYYADIKRVPEGKWTLTYAADLEQNQAASAPVVVTSVSGITGKKERGGKLRCAELKNRSTRTVKAVQLRWVVMTREDRVRVLAQGKLPRVKVEIAAGSKLKVELREAQFADFVQPLVRDGVLTGDYHVSVGVARVEFTDGTAEERAGGR